MVLPNRNGIEGKREEERIDSIFIKKMLSRQLEIGRELDRVGIGRRERGRDGGKEGRGQRARKDTPGRASITV